MPPVEVLHWNPISTGQLMEHPRLAWFVLFWIIVLIGVLAVFSGPDDLNLSLGR